MSHLGGEPAHRCEPIALPLADRAFDPATGVLEAAAARLASFEPVRLRRARPFGGGGAHGKLPAP